MPSIETLAGDLLASSVDLAAQEALLVAEGAPLEEQIAVKLARSKSMVRSHPGPLHASVVFAMYRETERMLTPEQHPHGEDFITRKAGQLDWLFDGNGRWDLVLVDDGCPDGSGQLAESIIEERNLGSAARVLHLADAIERGHPAAAGLSHTDESRKGGSILYGMYEAAQRSEPGHVVVYTDADLSTNLGQVGLLVDAVAKGAVCAAGSRREPTSVVVKGGARNDRGKLFIYIWKQMLPQLQEMIDTQCGFKGFPGESVPTLTRDSIERQFAFDIELLLRCAIGDGGPIARVPVAWVDSEEASTTTELDPYLDMLTAVARMYRTYLAPSDRPEQFARLVEGMAPAQWRTLVDSIPQEIVGREPLDFATWADVSAADLAAILEA